MTSKQKKIYDTVRRFGKISPINPMQIGEILGQPRKKAEKWAKPALKELVKLKLVERIDGNFQPKVQEATG